MGVEEKCLWIFILCLIIFVIRNRLRMIDLDGDNKNNLIFNINKSQIRSRVS